MPRLAKVKGMVLLTTFTMILLISILVLTCLQQNGIYAKILGRQQIKEKTLYAMENLALKLARLIDAGCTRDTKSDNILEVLPREGCIIQEENRTFRYLVENMGVFPCWQIATKKGSMSSQHLRLSIMTDKGADNGWFLQLWKVIPVVSHHACQGMEVGILSGITSVRMGVLLR